MRLHAFGNLTLLLPFTFYSQAQGLSSSSALATPNEKAIVIGGGPVGLATALTLADEPHCFDVTLFEAATPTAYDPTKAYLYNVNERGLRFTKRYDFLQKRLEAQGVASKGMVRK